MKFYMCMILLCFAQISRASYSDYIDIRNESGDTEACDLVKEYYESTISLYEKVYFYKAKNGCYYRSEKFKKFSLDEKKKVFSKNAEELANLLKTALDSNESPDKDLLDLVGVSENYPKLYERLEKKKINAYMNRPIEAPDENEGDVHSVSYFVASDYEKMIYRYLYNDMPEDAQRLAKEYGQYPWAGDLGVKEMQDQIEIYKERLEQKKNKSNDKTNEKVDPKEVTAELKKALNDFEKVKVSASEYIKSQNSQKVKSDENKSTIENESTADMISRVSFLERYWLFVLAFLAIFGMYFYSRSKNKK